jgi:hypothetical protein
MILNLQKQEEVVIPNGSDGGEAVINKTYGTYR